jgi:hypothetical protein
MHHVEIAQLARRRLHRTVNQGAEFNESIAHVICREIDPLTKSPAPPLRLMVVVREKHRVKLRPLLERPSRIDDGLRVDLKLGFRLCVLIEILLEFVIDDPRAPRGREGVT